jgi:GTP pyrophosphokinase
MVVAMAKDIRVLLVKLADRTHNMRTLEHMKPEKQERIARETLDIYAPLANRLGIQWVKSELEDLSFKYLNPTAWNDLAEKVHSRAKERDRFIADVVSTIQGKLVESGVKAEVYGRVKHLYSIWRKMRVQNIEFAEVHDVIAFRVLVDSVAHCYESLGMIHALWKPVPGRFKDYIAIPKPNMYQSLHTTVIGPAAERIEVQIRTHEMHKIAEEGVAAHWAYKDAKAGRDGISAKDAQKFGWLRQLVEWQRDVTDPKEFLETVKVDLFADEVFVFTPKGDVKSLPRGATPVDLAYAIHSDVGAQCAGAKVNGKIVPLRYKLKNGDTIEILTSPTAHPSKDWLGFVKTSRAQTRIRGFIRQLEHKRSLEIGKDMVEREMRRWGASLAKAQRAGELDKAAGALGYKQGDDVLVAVGYGKIAPAQLLQHLLPADKLAAPPPAPEQAQPANRLTELFRKVAAARKPAGGVRLQGIDDVLVRYGKCCNPVPGDDIVGFITRGRGVTVHTKGCDKILEMDPLRRVDVGWDEKAADVKRPVSIKVVTDDRPGVLAKISTTIADAGMNISQATCRTTGLDRAVNTFEIATNDAKQLRSVMKNIERIDGVVSVERFHAGVESPAVEA